jgi:hypothetical protein
MNEAKSTTIEVLTIAAHRKALDVRSSPDLVAVTHGIIMRATPNDGANIRKLKIRAPILSGTPPVLVLIRMTSAISISIIVAPVARATLLLKVICLLC